VEPGWWAYTEKKISVGLPKYDPRERRGMIPLSRERVRGLAAQLPRCAQRAREVHGGDSKVAWPTQGLAWRVADALKATVYKCPLPAPAIGDHWHVTTRKKHKRPR
jgi:hypothetical protein